ncbi:MAG: hypothetical protein IPI33_12755 [Dehalococcoidia bacterium]|nr:hypothetical protein [Dehalococcoidia bacterium]
MLPLLVTTPSVFVLEVAGESSTIVAGMPNSLSWPTIWTVLVTLLSELVRSCSITLSMLATGLIHGPMNEAMLQGLTRGFEPSGKT